VSLQAVPREPAADDDRATGPLDRCTGDAGAFLLGTWGVRAALHRSADPAGFADLLTFDDVDRLLTTTSLRTPAFRLVKAGERIPETAYTRSGTTGSKPVSGMVDPARVAESFRGGATIVLQGLHRYLEPVARFCRDLELSLGHPCQVNAYITPPGAQGLALHEDPHDVFVLQAFGRKHWEVHAAPAEPAREPIEATVATGDCVYMPAGTPHAATTQDELSGHLTIGVHVTPWGGVVDRVWRRLSDLPELAEPMPAGWTSDPDTAARLLGERLEAVGAAIAGVDARAEVDAEIRRFLSTRAPALRGIFAQEPAVGSVGDDTRLVRRPGSVCELRPAGDRLTVLLGDRRLDMPAWLGPAMAYVRDHDGLSPTDLTSFVPDAASRSVLARRLIREGLLLVGDGS
jgi:hypothetical protein